MHHRLSPKPHRFVYRLFLFALDLDELGKLHRSLRIFSAERPNLYSFREADYFPVDEPAHAPTAARPPLVVPPTSTNQHPLKARVIAYLAAHQIDLAGGRIVLLTLPRVLGYLFNPVSFYFCFDQTGAPIATIAEVTNTFREVKLYLLGPSTRLHGPSAGSACPAEFHLRVPKEFYVSPYSAADMAFDFTLRVPDHHLALQIDDYNDQARILTSTLTGKQRALSDRRLVVATLQHPFVTLKIIALIHWHALRLLIKRVPWFRKRDGAAHQRDLYRPHASLVSPSS